MNWILLVILLILTLEAFTLQLLLAQKTMSNNTKHLMFYRGFRQCGSVFDMPAADPNICTAIDSQLTWGELIQHSVKIA